MVNGWFQRAVLPCFGAFVLSCQAPAAPSNGAKPIMPSSPSTPASSPSSSVRSFEEDVEFLTKHGQIKVLSAASGGRIAVSSQYQARVMTSAVGSGKASLGFINRQFIE